MSKDRWSNMPRRGFLGFAAKSIFAGTLLGISPWVEDVRTDVEKEILRKGASVAISIMDRSKNPKDSIRQPETPRQYPRSGWLETSLPGRADLLNLNDGGGAYVKYMITNQLVLKHAF